MGASAFLAGLGASQASGITPPFFLPGNYRVELVEMKFIVSRKKETLFIANGKVITSDNAQRPAGTLCGQTVNMKQEGALGNIKNLFLAILGWNGNDPAHVAGVTEVLVGQMIDNPASWHARRFLDLQCHNKPTRTNGEYTVHNWQTITTA